VNQIHDMISKKSLNIFIFQQDMFYSNQSIKGLFAQV
jgi:hypothetical protein